MTKNINRLIIALMLTTLLPFSVSANAASAFFSLPTSPVLPLGDTCADYTTTSTPCVAKTAVYSVGPPPITCTSTCDATGTAVHSNFIDYLDQQVFQGRWYASCGKKADGTFDIGYADLLGKLVFRAELKTDLFGNALTGAAVVLEGRVSKTGPDVSAEATTIRNEMDVALRDTNIWACQSPPGFIGGAPLLPYDTGEFGNPWCPPGCAPPPTAQAYRYKIEFLRPGCAGGSSDVNCNIPEGFYSINMDVSGLRGRLAPPAAPALINPRASGGPVAGGLGLVPPFGLGYELWATDEWKNVPPTSGPPIEQPMCGGTCPNVYNDHQYVWPYVSGEEIRLATTSPEMFMIGSIKLESGRDSSGDPIFTDFHGSATPLLVTGDDPLGFIISFNPSAIVGTVAASNIALGNTPAVAPWNSGNLAFPRNMMNIQAIENPKITTSRLRPQNIVMGPGTFTPVLNVIRQGYAPYTIHQGMAGNQCSLLKAGRKMLTDGAALSSRTSQTLVYVGGCPSDWGTATKFNTFDVNWFANSNYQAGFKPGDMDPITLALRAMNSPRTTNMKTGTEQCFRDVGGTANSFVVVTGSACPDLAATATNTAVGSNSSFGCRGGCSLGVGGDTTSDCAAKILQCLSGPARLVN